MDDHFADFFRGDASDKASLRVAFDAEQATPGLIDSLAAQVPQIRRIMASLRQALPLVPHSGIGPLGRFYRLPNHYRSVSFMLPPEGPAGLQPAPGVVVFKGTEPLIADFPAYFDWMLGAPFRSSALPLALHFPLDMKLPPAAMWIEECLAEQAVSSRLQQLYLERHGRLARLPLPLFVFRMTPAQLARYEEVVCSRLSADANRKIRNKLSDGLGVEVYYYPELPVRVADLFVGNVRETFKDALAPEQVEITFGKWARLLSEILCLGYMPYAPWHHGMGSCCDQGNVCIDGGFNDLLTLVPFDAIPDDVLFRQSLAASTRMLAESMASLAAASVGMAPAADSEAIPVAAGYINDRLREHVRAMLRDGHAMDARLKRVFEVPGFPDVVDVLRKSHRGRGGAPQFIGGVEQARPALEARDLHAAADA